MFKTRLPLILASASPRRHELLSSLGVEYRVSTSDAEPAPLAGEAPRDYAARAARSKALDVQAGNRAQGRPQAVLAADTIVVLDGQIIGKPSDHREALSMLLRLAGRCHTVYTACVLLLDNGDGQPADERAVIEQSEVCMQAWPESLLKAYADSPEPMDKAGAYAVQGQGAFLIKSISGSWSNVVGLPLSQVCALLLETGVIAPEHPPLD